MKLSDLITTVSEVTGEEHGVVRVKARALREAGLLKQGGRGRAGAEMEPRDVARLVLSLLSSQSTTTDRQIQSIEAAQLFNVRWAFHSGFPRSIHSADLDSLPPVLRDLGADQSITDALSRILSEGLEVIGISNEKTQDGEAVALGFRGETEDPDEGGIAGCDWWLDFAVPSPSPSKITTVRKVDGLLVNEIAARALGRANQ